jgi:hypothetical protein
MEKSELLVEGCDVNRQDMSVVQLLMLNSRPSPGVAVHMTSVLRLREGGIAGLCPALQFATEFALSRVAI